MSDQGGYSIAMRIKQGCTACEERAKLKETSIRTLLHDLASSGQEEFNHKLGKGKGQGQRGQAASLRFDEQRMRARNLAERRAEDFKLETLQRNHWNLFWRSFIDPRTKRSFYFNFLTGERQWKKPRGMGRGRGDERGSNLKEERQKSMRSDGSVGNNRPEEDGTNGDGTKGDAEGDESDNEVDPNVVVGAAAAASPPSLKEQGLTPKERKRLSRAQSMNSAKYLINQTWGGVSLPW